jgi:hypothetical protein
MPAFPVFASTARAMTTTMVFPHFYAAVAIAMISIRKCILVTSKTARMERTTIAMVLQIVTI